MKKINFSQIRKLPPQEKIKVLNQVEAELNKLIADRKKEIGEKNQEIQEAEDLLREAEEESRVLEQIETPEIKRVDIDKLFKKEKESLEGIAQTAKSTDREREQRIEELRKTPVEELYNQVKTIEEEIKKTGVETAYQQNKIEEIHDGIYRKKQDVEEERYIVGEREEALMTTVEKTLKKFYEKH